MRIRMPHYLRCSGLLPLSLTSHLTLLFLQLLETANGSYSLLAISGSRPIYNIRHLSIDWGSIAAHSHHNLVHIHEVWSCSSLTSGMYDICIHAGFISLVLGAERASPHHMPHNRFSFPLCGAASCVLATDFMAACCISNAPDIFD